MTKLTVLLAAIVPLALPAAASAQAADQDVRCVMAGNVFATAEKDPAKKQLAFATGLFFAGRADARLSPAQLKAQILMQGKALTAATLPQVMTDCARTFREKERALQAIGQSVATQAKK